VRPRNLSQEQVKIRILSYLYHKQEGTNAHTIQFEGILGRTLEANRFKILLEELCEIKCIEKVPMDHVTAGRSIYKITDKGRGTIQKLCDELILGFFGLKDEDI
jgi:hypothetical protein